VNKLFPNLAPVSREFLEKHRDQQVEEMKKNHFKDEQAGLLTRASPIVEWYTWFFFFRNGIPIRGGSTIRIKNDKEFGASVVSREVKSSFCTDNYCLVVNESLHRVVQKALNPFNRLLNRNIHLVLDAPIMEDGGPFSYYTVEAVMSPGLMIAMYESILLHEGKHVLDRNYGQIVPGKDITVKNNEIRADNNIQDQNLLTAAILQKNLTKLMRIYQGWTGRSHIDRNTELLFLERYSDLLSYDLKKREGSAGKNYPDDFHPCENERIALLKKSWKGSKQHREVTVTIYYQEPGKEKRVHRILVLKEQDGWEIRL